MRVFNHVFNTWMLAQFLHPIVFFGYFSIILNESIDPGALVSLLVGSFIIAAPSLFISFLFLRLIVGKKISAGLSLFIWIVIVIASIILNLALFLFLLNSNIVDTPLEYILPAVIAAVVSILIRLPLFISLSNDLKYISHQNQALPYEN